MNILLSRILTYLNGTLFHDYNYKICTFIIFHYLEMEDMSEEEFLKKGCFKKEELYSFIALLGFKEYEEFKETLVNHHQTRLNQIRVRMIGVDSREFIEKMDLLLQQNHALYFYVASDDESEKCRLKEIFKDRVITQPMTDYNRDSFQGIENSVVELYNLSCCKKILGSYGSSFSEIASRFGHCEFIMVSDNIDRDSRKLLEVDINKLDEPKLTRKEWFYYYLHFFQFYK